MVTLAFAQMVYFVVPRHQARRRQRRHLPVRQAGARDRRPTLLDLGERAARSTTSCSPRWSRPTPSSRCCCARASAARWPASASTSSACAPPASSTYGYKLAAFVSPARSPGSPASCSRCKDGFVNPELLSWHESGAVLLMLILGGIGHLRGAVLGAVAFTLLKELFQSRGAARRRSPTHWQLTLGADDHRVRRAAAAAA